MAAFLSLGERLDFKANALTSSGRPSPAFNLNFRWSLYRYLLSILESIIQQTKGVYIKITLQVCYKKFFMFVLQTK